MCTGFNILSRRFHSIFFLFVLFIMIGVTYGCGGSSSSDSGVSTLTVATAFGSVKGSSTPDGVWAWLGIPYAKPPVGALRWTAPVDPDKWTGVRDATTPCSKCSQQVTDKFWRPGSGFTGSEDCLYLSIYRPPTMEKGLPVFVWIHGGANIIGEAGLYNGAELAKRGNIIVVVIQYRLGMLGWLTHPALRSGTADDNSGNYGTLDQIKALVWVQNNIAAFGGNPGKVTIGGQSAGGQAVMNMIISPETDGLFQKAFAESPALSSLMPLRNQAAGDTQTNSIIDQLLVDDDTAATLGAADTIRAGMSNSDIATYLRGKTAALIMTAALEVGLGSMPTPTPFMDGTVMPTTDWLTAINNGDYKKVPLIIGTTQYEFKDLMTLYSGFLALYGVPSTAPTYTWNSLYTVINETGTPTLANVLTSSDQWLYESTGLMKSREWQSECNTIARAIKTDNSANTVYSYYFTWAGGGDPALADFKFIFGASHAQDIPFFFGDSTDLFQGYSFTAANQGGRVALQGAMMDYLLSFVKSGSPNPAGSALLNWTQWSNTDGANKYITFDANLNNYLLAMSSAEATPAIIASERATYISIGGALLAGLWLMLGI